MAFYESNAEQKQHLNLSGAAYSVIENDRILFGLQTPASIINRVFHNYKEDAEASIAIVLEKRREELKNTLREMDEPYRRQAIEYMLTEYEQILLFKINSYEKGESFKFRINNENYEYLTSGELCQEEKYYNDHIGKYIKALIEEYARQPFVKREKIYFAAYLEIIERAIEKNKKVKIKLYNGTEYIVTPFNITVDSQNTYNYFVAVSENGTAWSYRLSGLQEVKILNSKKGRLNLIEKKQIDEEIKKKGVQFLGNPTEEIKVRLTDEGKKKYEKLLFLRPKYIKIEADNIYCFDCTTLQIEFYFFKFGKDALVMQPEALKKKFSEEYLEAGKHYF